MNLFFDYLAKIFKRLFCKIANSKKTNEVTTQKENPFSTFSFTEARVKR